MNLKPSAPKTTTVIVSITLILLGLLGSVFSQTIANNGDWLLLVGFLILLAGVYLPDL